MSLLYQKSKFYTELNFQKFAICSNLGGVMVALVGCHAGGLGSILRHAYLFIRFGKKIGVKFVYFGEFRLKFIQKGDFSRGF